MNAASRIEPLVSVPMTWAEIIERYPDEWVCLVEIDRIEETHFAFRTARVAGHGKTPREPLDQARAVRVTYPSIGHYFTGKIGGPLPRFPS
jgi:hypothetical protein